MKKINRKKKKRQLFGFTWNVELVEYLKFSSCVKEGALSKYK
jgi:hypothetical protein